MRSNKIKTIKFRFLKESKEVYNIQVRGWFGWRYLMTSHGSNAGSYDAPSYVKTKEEGIERVYAEYPFKKDNLRLVQYPTLKVVK